MPFPAYQGLEFYFSIPRGGGWQQHFRVTDRTGDGIGSWTGWSAVMTITDNDGLILATLSTAGGADGTIALGDDDYGPDAIVCTLPAESTVELAATGTPTGLTDKPFLQAVLTLTDPLYPSEPYPFAVGKGVVTALNT